MRYNTYQSSSYQNRRRSRYQTPEKVNIWKRLIEEFLTQLIFCALIIGMIVVSKQLAIKKIDTSMEKVKTAITYSPSLNEIAKGAREKAGTILKKSSLEDQSIDYNNIPEIIIEEIE